MDQSGQIASAFGDAAGTFGQEQNLRRFPHFGRRLVAVAGLPTGTQVLDVAMGRGAVLFAAVERVGAHGKVTGIDLAPGMVEATALDIERRKLSNVDVHVMDAERLAFPGASFDA